LIGLLKPFGKYKAKYIIMQEATRPFAG